MSIEVACDCGRRLRARDEQAGKKAKCPGCGAILRVPNPALEDDILSELNAGPIPVSADPPDSFSSPISPLPRQSPTVLPSKPTAQVEASPNRVAKFAYMVLILALLPLAWSVFFTPSDPEQASPLLRTLKSHPEMVQKFEQIADREFSSQSEADAALATFMQALPDHRFDGAAFAYDTSAHWLIALLAAAAFFGLLLAVFRPNGSTSIKSVAIVGVITGTLGILFLLGVQYSAEWTQGRIMYGRSILVLFFYILKFIGFSYHAALDPSTNFFVSFFGFTFGVGLCEELCKAMPLLLLYRSPGGLMSWRGALLWGLISGVGFGVSEGITYSRDYYNGISGYDAYLIRFVSCVALHAVWSGASALMIVRRQDMLQTAQGIWSVMLTAVVLVLAPMILHGLYDTLLKKQFEGYALLAAIASFAWFFWQVEITRQRLPDENEPVFARGRAAVVR